MLIQLQKDKVTFSGPGTFQEKDNIKALAGARWDGTGKFWFLPRGDWTAEAIGKIFPAAEVIDVLASGSQITVPTVSTPDGAIAGTNIAPTNSPPLLPIKKSPTNDKSGLSVRQLTEFVRDTLQSALPEIVVYGVVSKVRRTTEGTVWIELADTTDPARHVQTVIWQNENLVARELIKAGFTIERDLALMITAKITVSKNNSLLLDIKTIIAEYTVSKLAALRDQTNERLKKEGLYDKNKQRTLPFLPRNLGVITSDSGTVIHDFRASLDEAHFAFKLLWLPTKVQGESAKREILAALKYFGKSKKIDAILLFRGGGSAAELSIFNDYEIARAIALSPLPVISAIGHQEDECSAQDVSWKACGVPKDIGHFLAGIVLDLRHRYHETLAGITHDAAQVLGQSKQLFQLRTENLQREVLYQLKKTSSALSGVQQSLPPLLAQTLVRRRTTLETLRREGDILCRNLIRQRLSSLRNAQQLMSALSNRTLGYLGERLRSQTKLIASHARSTIKQTQQQLKSAAAVIEAASPEQQLRRGFAIIKQSNSFITRAADISTEISAKIIFFDGSTDVSVTTVDKTTSDSIKEWMK
ncbi:MAG: exodeoxyribonuclease VII large subunit [bacterium]|nr:exodeoxyribonuclease VII large subunit [bacterium]